MPTRSDNETMQKSHTSKWLSSLVGLLILFSFAQLSSPVTHAQNVEVAAINLFDGRVVYTGEDGNIYYLDGATGISQPLTSDATLFDRYYGPTFSPTGQHIAYCRDDEEINSATLYVAAVDDLAAKALVHTFDCGYDWSSDGLHIVYGHPSEYDYVTWKNASGIWSVDIRTGFEIEIVPRPRTYPLKNPIWSPDGNWMLFEEVSYIEGRGQIYTWSKSDKYTVLAPVRGAADWSPDSESLVFDEIVYIGRENQGIYLTRPNSSIYRRRLYSHPSYYATDPQFSPDGTHIAFILAVPLFDTSVSTVEGREEAASQPNADNDRIAVINRDGRLVKSSSFPVYSVIEWLPDGQRLLVSHPKSDHTALSFYNLNDSSLTTIVEAFGSEADWMPTPPKYRIIGTVADPAGAGIEGVRITDNVGHATETNQFGAYELAGIPAGNYTLTAHKDGYTFGPKSLNVSLNQDIDGQNFLGTNKPPLVFVHGWNGLNDSCEQVNPDEYFHLTDDRLRYSAYYVEYAYLETSSCYTPPLIINTVYLRAAIQRAKLATGQPKVILIAHSMGGLVSRAYIESESYRDDVLKLFTFGSPHEGVPHEVLLHLLNTATFGTKCMIQAGACEFTESSMAIFNEQHRQNPDVEYHLISGDAPFWSRNNSGRVMAGLIPGADDGIVPASSGTAVEAYAEVDRFQTDEVHNLSFGVNTYFTRNGGPSNSDLYCLEAMLVEGGSACVEPEMTTSELSSQMGSLEAIMVRSPFIDGQVDSNETVTHTVNLPGGTTVFAAQWISGAATFVLMSPVGELITPSTLDQNPQLGTYEATAAGATYVISETTAGTWEMIVSAEEGNVDYRLFAVFEGDGYPEVESDSLWYQPGVTATITVTPPVSVVEASIVAQVTYADGSAESVVAEPAATGSYQISFAIPNIPGYAEVYISLHTTNTASIPLDYGAFHQIQVMGGAFQLTGSYAEAVALNTRFADLFITANIMATQSGAIGLSADLVDSQGELVSHAFTVYNSTTGVNAVTLVFSGKDIFELGVDGPFLLTNVLLTDQRGVVLVADTAEAAYMTNAYPFGRFKLPTVDLPVIHR